MNNCDCKEFEYIGTTDCDIQLYACVNCGRVYNGNKLSRKEK